jgi:hypothetical protein
VPPASQPLFDPDAPFTLPAEPAAAEHASSAKSARPKLKLSRKAIVAAAAIVILAGGGVFASRYMGNASSAGASTTGTLVVQSNPAGVQVVVDGVERGQTPARLSVTPGAHIPSSEGAVCRG